ncbi:hypothetical protein BJ165DRAFT_1524553 [Panaeolus papilionaceus]|nr:hypothetical protein BJ165DRAFT_1524553 [Panaeolus papilionaceus]
MKAVQYSVLHLDKLPIWAQVLLNLGTFGLISVYFATTSTVVFGSRIYRYIFSTWPFFATITITTYCLVIASVILAVISQFNFGQGLKQYLLVTEALEGVDFTPVSMPVAEMGHLQSKDPKTTEFLVFPVTALQPKHRQGILVSAYSTKDGRPVATSFDSFFPIKAVDSRVLRVNKPSYRPPAYAGKTRYTSFTSAGASQIYVRETRDNHFASRSAFAQTLTG